MKIEVEVPDGEYCDGCIFKKCYVAYSICCLLLHNKHLNSKPTTIIRNGRNNVLVEHTLKDKDCPSLKGEVKHE
jgi:hypothetical protein